MNAPTSNATARLRQNSIEPRPTSVSREGVGVRVVEPSDARSAVPSPRAALPRTAAPSNFAKRRCGRPTSPISGAFTLDRVGTEVASRSAALVGPGKEKRLLTTLILAMGLAFALGAAPLRAAAQGGAGEVLKLYGTMYEALVTNKTEGVAESAAKIADLAAGCARSGAVAKECGALAAAAKKVVGKDLESLRGEFKELSIAADGYLRAAKASGWDLYYCPMADGYWIQTAEGVRNPYYGPSMLKCGDKVPGVAAG